MWSLLLVGCSASPAATPEPPAPQASAPGAQVAATATRWVPSRQPTGGRTEGSPTAPATRPPSEVAPAASPTTPSPRVTPLPTPVRPSLSPPTPAPTLAVEAVVRADVLNVRAGPGTEHPVVAKVRSGDRLEVLARNDAGTWFRVRMPGGPVGWVASEWVALEVAAGRLPVATPLPSPTATLHPPSAGRVRARVVRVTDGDSIEVEIEGQVYRVRYIGINCPEGTEPLGQEAARKNAELVEGKVVELERDVSDTDRYGRLLRYVWVGDLLVNGELVRLGYARARAYPPDVRYHDLFVQLEEEAREAGRGLWGLVPTPGLRDGNCDPAYPTVCIPPPPPDLDCGDVPYRRFPVLPPDPHNFDGDHDGVGCEGG